MVVLNSEMLKTAVSGANDFGQSLNRIEAMERMKGE